MQYCIAVSERSTWFSRSVLDNIDNGLMYITLPDCVNDEVLNECAVEETQEKMPARNTINSGVRYSRLASDEDGYIDLQVRGKGF